MATKSARVLFLLPTRNLLHCVAHTLDKLKTSLHTNRVGYLEGLKVQTLLLSPSIVFKNGDKWEEGGTEPLIVFYCFI